MTRRFQVLCLVLISALWLVPARAAFAYPDGPPDGVCGTPLLELDCTVCHGDFAANSGCGSLELLGLPTAFQPGGCYDLTARVQDPGQHEWGFEAAALDLANQQAGEFAVVDALRTQLSKNSGTNPDFIKQTSADASGDPGGSGQAGGSHLLFDGLELGGRADVGPVAACRTCGCRRPQH